jgi:hypothetical protein
MSTRCYVQRSGSDAQDSFYGRLLFLISELDLFSHQALLQFPKVERFLLCADIRQSISKIQKLTITAWKRYHKKTTLQELDIEVEILRRLICKSQLLRHINQLKFQSWIDHINEVGKMVGGWIKSLP